mgnify:CR=1 FL=1|tara:strand:+ start:14269 stop:15123 length:855 start_codon:yes stop_codon:yes gene_type:complete
MRLLFFVLFAGSLNLFSVVYVEAKRTLLWKPIQKGIRYTRVRIPGAKNTKDPYLHVVRVEPNQVDFHIHRAHLSTKRLLTAKQWAKRLGVPVVVNMGMYQRDLRSHVGYLRRGKKVYQRRWRKTYLSVFAFGPRKKGIPAATILDLDQKGTKQKLKLYHTVIQNLRLIKASKGRGVGVWSQKKRRHWSEAALGLDKKGRLLILFSHVMMNMWRWNRFVLSLPLGVLRAMHLDGGPPASVTISTSSFQYHGHGGGAGIFSRYPRFRQVPIPNVIGISAKRTKGSL